ncbi:MAG: hypothetical protein JSR82_17050 [Verrucomicrobia bacterium]|nr:hypothetical protein [Verrucomicrobiota bacterium]
MNDLRQILASKAALRRRLARLPVAEKLRLVEQLAERTRAIRRHQPSRPPHPDGERSA